MKRYLIFTCLVILVAIPLFYFIVLRDKDSRTNKSSKIYDAINVQTYDKVSSGVIWIENSSLKYDITFTDITNYINENKESWTKSELEYTYGGMHDDGTIWDGVKKTTIDKDDFIIAIYQKINNKFKDKYIITLREKSI